jgi:hypothetical protein
MKPKIGGLLAVGLLFAIGMLAPLASFANVVYYYTGPTFVDIGNADSPSGEYTTTMRLSAKFTVSGYEPPAPNTPLTGLDFIDYELFDGRRTLTPSNTYVPCCGVALGTDAAGQINSWLYIIIGYQGSGADVQEVWQVSCSNFADPDCNVFGGTGNLPLFPSYPGATAADYAAFCQLTDPQSGSGCPSYDRASVANSPGSWSWAVVPEPATAWLFGLGLAGLGAVRRKKLAA